MPLRLNPSCEERVGSFLSWFSTPHWIRTIHIFHYTVGKKQKGWRKGWCARFPKRRRSGVRGVELADVVAGRQGADSGPHQTLARIVAASPELPEATRRAILALVDIAGQY